MRFHIILITVLGLIFFSCEDDSIVVFPEEIIINCQEDADMAKLLIGDAIFDEDEPDRGFRGDIIIDPAADCGTPLTDLSLFENYRFWLGGISIETDAITDLSFLNNMEQIRGGLTIRNCGGLTSIILPKMGAISNVLDIQQNPNLTSIEIGAELPEFYDRISIDSLVLQNNPILTEWKPGLQIVDFGRYASIAQNESLTSLTALSELSMPSRFFTLDMYGTTINVDGINPTLDSLTMPQRTQINALLPDNDYSWLDTAKERFRFQNDTILIDSIVFFRIDGDVEIEEVCPLQGVMTETPLEIESSRVGTITAEILADECL